MGEVRGGEVVAMLRALGNGAAGGMCTVHARTAYEVFDRIAALAQLAEPPLPVETAYRWTASAIDLVAHVEKADITTVDGRRRRSRTVTHIVEVGRVGEGGRPDATALFELGPGGGLAPAYPASPSMLDDLRAAGLDPSLLAVDDSPGARWWAP